MLCTRSSALLVSNAVLQRAPSSDSARCKPPFEPPVRQAATACPVSPLILCPPPPHPLSPPPQQALEFLLSTAPRALFAAFPKQYGTFAKASRADHQLKQQHMRISALYA